ncbi:helix-turn-helix domain-containing protein [Spongiimicrobium salis]|uniref:helix-turn-helix domain-containing protein n=1 Tax=Spongiimicrobium salis TaxID=1667022 RepID=UPI00374CBF5A
MKQPELGQKILALRQQKGLTQEELVAQCNISVRTIQRIEAGEVIPRSYTVKSILNALDYDIGQLQFEESRVSQEFKKLFLFTIDDDKEAGFLIRQLNIAWICGLIYFLLGFLETGLYLSRFFEGELILGKVGYISIELITLGTFILFMRGFILTGKIVKNYFLKIAAFITIFVSGLFYVYDILSLFIDEFSVDFILGASSIAFGMISIFFGIALFRLQPIIGSLAAVAAVFELIASFFFLTVILSWIGLIFLLPAVLLEVILLYKMMEMLSAKQTEIQMQ